MTFHELSRVLGLPEGLGVGCVGTPKTFHEEGCAFGVALLGRMLVAPPTGSGGRRLKEEIK